MTKLTLVIAWPSPPAPRRRLRATIIRFAIATTPAPARTTSPWK